MATLTNLPLVNQLNSPTLDGGPDNNKWFNCVVCAILSVILLYHPEYRGKLSPDIIKDAVYGPEYANGGTDITRFLLYANQHGVSFSNVSGTNAVLVAQVHRLVQAGHPVIGTEVDPYVDTTKPQYAGWLHSFVFYAESPGTLSIMDPFGGKIVEKPDSEWEAVLRTGSVWVGSNALVATAPAPAPALSEPLTKAGWHDDGTRLFSPNGHFAVDGFRRFTLAEDAAGRIDPDDWFLEEEHGQAVFEDSDPTLGGGTQQLTLFGGMNWNVQHGVFRMAAGKEVQKNRTQIAALWTQVQLAKTDLAALIGILKSHGIQITDTGATALTTGTGTGTGTGATT